MSILSEVMRGIFRGHILGYKGTEENRVRVEAARGPGELHSTVIEEFPDAPMDEIPSRFFVKNVLMSGGKWQGLIGSQATMLALNTSSVHKCRPLDFCKRTDTGNLMICFQNNGTSAADWIAIPTADEATALGHWSVVTNGNPSSPEVVFDASGDIVESFVID